MSFLEDYLGELKSRLASILISAVSGLVLAVLTAAYGENINACPLYYSHYVGLGIYNPTKHLPNRYDVVLLLLTTVYIHVQN